MEQFGSGLVAGISVPNTPMIADALDYAQRLSEPYLFNHAVRSWLFAISIARAKNINYACCHVIQIRPETSSDNFLRDFGERFVIVEHLLGQSLRIGCRLHHQGGYRANDSRLGYAALAMPRYIVHDLAAAGRMADVNGVLQIEMGSHRREIVGIVIHVVAVACLSGSAVAPSVMRNDAIAFAQKK